MYDPALATPVDVMQDKGGRTGAIGPVVYSPAHGGHWIVTHYKEIQEVLTNPETFSSYPTIWSPAISGKFIPLELDPPEHTSTGKRYSRCSAPSG